MAVPVVECVTHGCVTVEGTREARDRLIQINAVARPRGNETIDSDPTKRRDQCEVRLFRGKLCSGLYAEPVWYWLCGNTPCCSAATQIELAGVGQHHQAVNGNSVCEQQHRQQGYGSQQRRKQ
jgi:hypothetical protein